MKFTAALAVLFLLVHPALRAQDDVVEFFEDDPEACCFKFSVSNEHTPESPITRIRLSVVTPGVTVTQGGNNPWPSAVEEDTMLVFGEEGYELEPNDVLEDFSICFDRLVSTEPRFKVVWRTEYMDEVISKDTVEFECEDIEDYCDSVSVASWEPSNQQPGSCCYDFTLHNVNFDRRALDGIELVSFDPSVRIVGTPSGPWRIAEQTERRVTFRVTPDSLPAGQSIGGFRLCVRADNPTAGPVSFIWRTLKGELLICEGLVTASCEPYEPRQCDSLMLEKTGECGYDFGFRNTHAPPSILTGFRIDVLTPDAQIDTVQPPGGWDIVTQSDRAVAFASESPAGVASGDSLDGFLLRFVPSTSGSFDVAWCTMLDDSTVCCDTITLECEPPAQVDCDSLLVTRQGESCTYDFGFVNTHDPQSGINFFTIRLPSGGGQIADAAAPAPWIVSFRNNRIVEFRDTLGVVPPSGELRGFFVTFSPPGTGSTVRYTWCTGLDTLLHCCRQAEAECESQEERCDSLFVDNTEDYCSYAFGFANLHVPISGVDGFSVRLTSAETLIRGAEAPDGWLIAEEQPDEVVFRKIGSPLPSGLSATDFILDLLPSATDTRIPLTMCTLIGDTVLCCDTTTVFCDFALVQCDTLDVITSSARPCCFEFELRNGHVPQSPVEGFNVEILTPDVIFYPTTVEDPDGWLHTATATRISWSSRSATLQPGATLGGFTVCYDNDATGNADFRISWETVDDDGVLCRDTLTVKCDRTLDVRRLPGEIPSQFMLHQNYPNPFNPTTTIMFEVPHPAEVTLSLFDSRGRLVMDLGSRHYMAGSYRITLDAADLPSGTYFYQLRSAEYSKTRSLLLLQ